MVCRANGPKLAKARCLFAILLVQLSHTYNSRPVVRWWPPLMFRRPLPRSVMLLCICTSYNSILLLLAML